MEKQAIAIETVFDGRRKKGESIPGFITGNTKAEFIEFARKEGFVATYSGHDRTFYLKRK